ncbi:hypothetical protein L6R46_15855, partial [Myxococcota bacterium]|nr:hypothetical protein [Myxococcota bacterium]
MKSRPLFLILLSAGLLWSSSLVALAEDLPTSPTQSTWTDAEVEALVQRLVLDHASHTAAKGSVADEQEIALLTQLAQKDAELRKKIAALTNESKQRQALEGELTRLSAERWALVKQLAERNLPYSVNLEQYRRQMASLARSPDPRKRAALQAYADGDRLNAFDALVMIQEAETRAVAAGWRELATLAEDMKDRGEKSTLQVIAVWERAQALDATDSWGWLRLGNLYMEVGDLSKARASYARMLSTATWDGERVVALIGIGDAAKEAGDLPGARKAYDESLTLSRALLDQNPQSADVRRAV